MEGPHIPAGHYRARAIAGGLGKTKDGNPQLSVKFALIDDDYKGKEITWNGYFTDKTFDRTIESLQICGWEGDDLSDLRGIDANEVSIVVEHAEYDGKVTAKVAWVNRLGSLVIKTPMTAEQAKSFAAQMKGRVIAAKRAAGGTSAAKPTVKKQTAPSEELYEREPGEDDMEF